MSSWLAELAKVAAKALVDAVVSKLTKKSKRKPPAAPSTTSADSGLLARYAAMVGPPCDLPPIGWRCTRYSGHKGPCAAVRRQ